MGDGRSSLCAVKFSLPWDPPNFSRTLQNAGCRWASGGSQEAAELGGQEDTEGAGKHVSEVPGDPWLAHVCGQPSITSSCVTPSAHTPATPATPTVQAPSLLRWLLPPRSWRPASR